MIHSISAVGFSPQAYVPIRNLYGSKNVNTSNNLIADFPKTQISHHSNMFKARLNLQKVSFNGVKSANAMAILKESLSIICRQTIEAYDAGNMSIKASDFTRCYVHHCFDFSQDLGSDFDKFTRDPLAPNMWNYYAAFKHRMMGCNTVQGLTYERMTAKKDSWIENFIDIIQEEEVKSKNNLMRELLDASGDVSKIKEKLGVKV